MKYCPITYKEISNNEQYSSEGLRLLSPQLRHLKPLNYSAAEQREEAIKRTGKISIQGVQLKLSAQLKVDHEEFVLVDQFGRYILKPQSENYPELPENEALTMSLAELVGIEIPLHGLIYSKDNSLTYFIKRFDRYGKNRKVSQEDFSQLLGKNRETKYRSSMEEVAKVVQTYTTFPIIEAAKLLRLTLFNFLIGNEDMHLKNFSLITKNQKVMLSPAYDLLNSAIAIGNAQEELALPLNGKKNNLQYKDFIDYYGIQRLGLNSKIIDSILLDLQKAIPQWKELLNRSFLSQKMKNEYSKILEERLSRLNL